MSQLRSAIEEMTSFDPSMLSAKELAVEIGEALHGRQLLEAAIATWTKNLADRGGHLDLGYSSPTNLLADVGGLSPGHARQLVAWGNSAERAPSAYRAWADGRLSTDQARHLFAAADAQPGEYAEAEERLVEIVEGLDAVDTARAVEYWRQAVDEPAMTPETEWAGRGLSLSDSIGGWARVDGWLTKTCAEALRTGLEANSPPPREGDSRSPRQRRHDALENLCRDWLDNGTTPTVGGEKPHVVVHTDLDALRGLAGGLHETRAGGVLDVDTVRMIACDCSVSRIVFGPEGEVLDAGRKTRVWTTAQRRAVVARDRHCRGRGCRARAEHCDIHHEDHWADGGTRPSSCAGHATPWSMPKTGGGDDADEARGDGGPSPRRHPPSRHPYRLVTGP